MRGQDGIEDVAVIGLVNDLGTEEVVAAVVTADGLIPDLEELRSSVKQRLAAYKVPRRVFLVPELPRNEMGKVLRREVRKHVENMDIAERIAAIRPQLRSKIADARPDFGTWLPEIATAITDRLENMGPEVREKFENFDLDVRGWLADLLPELKERVEKMEIANRVEIFLSNFTSDDDSQTEQPDNDT